LGSYKDDCIRLREQFKVITQEVKQSLKEQEAQQQKKRTSSLRRTNTSKKYV